MGGWGGCLRGSGSLGRSSTMTRAQRIYFIVANSTRCLIAVIPRRAAASFAMRPNYTSLKSWALVNQLWRHRDEVAVREGQAMTDIQVASDAEVAAVEAEAPIPGTAVIGTALVVLGLTAEVLWLGLI